MFEMEFKFRVFKSYNLNCECSLCDFSTGFVLKRSDYVGLSVLEAAKMNIGL